MNKSVLLCILFLVGVTMVVVTYLFGGRYASSPGFVSRESSQAFYTIQPKCYGVSILLNMEAMTADAPGVSFCIGILSRH